MTIQNISDSHINDISEPDIKDMFSSINPFFNETNVVMYIVDSNTMKFVDVNHACERFYGWNRTEFRNKHLQNINQELIEHQLRHSNGFTYKTQHLCADGTLKSVEVFCSLVKIGDLSYWYEVIFDNTLQKLLEKEIEIHATFFEAILWTLSHEIRAPVARILGILDGYYNFDFINLNIDWFLKQIRESTDEIDANIYSLTHNISKMKSQERYNNHSKIK